MNDKGLTSLEDFLQELGSIDNAVTHCGSKGKGKIRFSLKIKFNLKSAPS